jgi:GTPase involved in cell partitioning and DNA repair
MVPFGFSVGDFFGAAGVIAQVVKALRQHGGAEDDYKTICFEVEAFGKLVAKVQALELNDGNKPHMEAIQEYAAYCKAKLEHFLYQISKYEASLGESASKSTWTEKSRGNARKAKWALLMDRPVSEMRDAIKMAGLTITLNLSLIH